jgi:hypothetical protein
MRITTTTTIPIGIDRQLPCSNISIVNLGTRITLSLLLATTAEEEGTTRCTPGEVMNLVMKFGKSSKKHLVKHLVVLKAYEWYS